MSILDPSETFTSLFESIGLDVRLRKAVARLGHVRPTLVQSKCLPITLSSGRDVMVRARTGSGKTLAYALPLLQKILLNPTAVSGVRALVLVPTRELCAQIHEILRKLTYYCDDVISTAVLSVGRGRGEKAKQDLERQAAMLRDQPSIVVATPAGVLTHIRSGAIDLKSSVETLVVDEADLVLSLGYSNDVAEIVKALPRICQGFLMSATLLPELDSLKKVVLHSPVVLKLEQEEDNRDKGFGKLKQFYLMLPKRDKRLVIYVFLKLGLLKGKGLFFVNSTDAGYRLKLFLEQFHIRSAVLNAELPFRSRMNIIEQFNVGNFDYLIATDSSTDAGNGDESDEGGEETETNEKKRAVRKDSEYGVSRGLDFRHVSFVMNVDFPPNARSYAHRVGRTARGGARGVALSLVEAETRDQQETLIAVQDDQPRTPLDGASTEKLQALPAPNDADADATGTAPIDQPQPVPLDFDLNEIEGFRYRVEDVGRAVTKIAVRETRAAELRAEILNSDRLEGHFEENPADLQLLQHDRVATHISKVQDHLKHVPKYLLPRGMQPANLNRKRKKRQNKRGDAGVRRSDKDPLRSFDGDVNLDGVEGREEDPLAEFMEDDSDGDDAGPSSKKKKVEKDETKIFAHTKDGTGHSTAGRRKWMERHGKGQFSSKKRKSERKKNQPLGV